MLQVLCSYCDRATMTCSNGSVPSQLLWLAVATRVLRYITMKLWHWKSHWKFLWHWKDTETTLKNIYKGNHSENSGLSHWNIFLCCSRTLKSHWKVLNHTEKFSALLIPFVPRFFSVTVNFQCDFQCHNFIVYETYNPVWRIWMCSKDDI